MVLLDLSLIDRIWKEVFFWRKSIIINYKLWKLSKLQENLSRYTYKKKVTLDKPEKPSEGLFYRGLPVFGVLILKVFHKFRKREKKGTEKKGRGGLVFKQKSKNISI